MQIGKRGRATTQGVYRRIRPPIHANASIIMYHMYLEMQRATTRTFLGFFNQHILCSIYTERTLEII